jgi:hypothetical protein
VCSLTQPLTITSQSDFRETANGPGSMQMSVKPTRARVTNATDATKEVASIFPKTPGDSIGKFLLDNLIMYVIRRQTVETFSESDRPKPSEMIQRSLKLPPADGSAHGHFHGTAQYARLGMPGVGPQRKVCAVI